MADFVSDGEPKAPKRRVVARTLDGVEQDLAAGRQQHPRAVAQVPPLLNLQAKQILGNGLDWNGNRDAAEDVVVSLT